MEINMMKLALATFPDGSFQAETTTPPSGKTRLNVFNPRIHIRWGFDLACKGYDDLDSAFAFLQALYPQKMSMSSASSPGHFWA